MKVAVITAYTTESLQYILRAHRSVLAQTYKNFRHFIVSGSKPIAQLDTLNCEHVKLGESANVGDIIKSAGAAIAAAQQYDAICFLNPESWYDPDHLEEMISAANRTKTTIVTCPRNIFRLDNSFMCVDQESDGIGYADINTYLIFKDSFSYLRALSFKDKKVSHIADRLLWKEIYHGGVKTGRSFKATVNSTTVFANHYTRIDEEVPEKSRIILQVGDEYKIALYEDYLKIVEAQKAKEKKDENELSDYQR